MKASDLDVIHTLTTIASRTIRIGREQDITSSIVNNKILLVQQPARLASQKSYACSWPPIIGLVSNSRL